MYLPQQILTGIIVTFTAAVVSVAVFIWWRFRYWRRQCIPYAAPIFPFGNCGDVFMGRRSCAHFCEDVYRKFQGEPYCGIFMALQPTLFIIDPELIKDVTIRYSMSHFVNHISQPDVSRDPLMAKNLFMLKGIIWKELRSKLNPAFSPGRVNMLFPFVLEKAQLLSKYLSEQSGNSGKKLNLKQYLAKFTTDVIGSCAFGLEINSIQNPNNDFFLMGLRLFEPTFRHTMDTTIIFQFPSLVKILRSVFVGHEVASFFRNLFWRLVNDRELNDIQRGDYMDYLIKLKNKNKQNVTKGEALNSDSKEGIGSHGDFDGDDFVAQALSFYLAGYETTSTLASFALFELAANPQVQEKLQEEIQSMLKTNNGKITYDAIQDVRYLDMVVQETLRKYPAFPFLDRVCTEEYSRPDMNLKIRKGTHLIIPVYALQNDPRYFPDPETFDPERFSEEGKKSFPSHCYMPFGDGPRICIGMRFALLQIKVVLISLLSKVRFSLPEELRGIRSYPFNPTSFLVAPKTGIHLVVENIRC